MITKLNQLLCIHQWLKKADGSRLYVECLHCGKKSVGITTGLDVMPEYSTPRTEMTCFR